jgi:membrane associated rhomboid family serine protease
MVHKQEHARNTHPSLVTFSHTRRYIYCTALRCDALRCAALVRLVHVQTLFTAGFLETNWALLAIDVVALSFAGGVFEPLWGVSKYLEFVLVVNVVGCLAIAITYIFAYVVLRDTQIL